MRSVLLTRLSVSSYFVQIWSRVPDCLRGHMATKGWFCLWTVNLLQSFIRSAVPSWTEGGTCWEIPRRESTFSKYTWHRPRLCYLPSRPSARMTLPGEKLVLEKLHWSDREKDTYNYWSAKFTAGSTSYALLKPPFCESLWRSIHIAIYIGVQSIPLSVS